MLNTDHGMTEDGNHGGGTENEINAALFAHFSPACGDLSLDLTPSIGSKYVQDAFQSIHQIDLVPTISFLLGLPVPYANLGSVVPSLMGFERVNETAAAMALNAAQVWRYFTVYSETANKLPNLPELQLLLEEAVDVYKQALVEQRNKQRIQMHSTKHVDFLRYFCWKPRTSATQYGRGLILLE